jgi:hypothetical protein
MSSVVSTVSARIPADRADEVIARFSEAVRNGLPERRQTSLLRGDDQLWQIVTVWNSRDDLDRYLASVEEPFALRLFRLTGGTPQVTVMETVLESATPFWS